MNRQEKIKLKRKEIAIMLGNKCQVCYKNFGSGFTFHHIEYTVGEKTQRDFKNSIDYQEFMCDIIPQRLDDFCILCKGHHLVLERLKRLKLDKIERLFDLVIRSKAGANKKR